MIHSSLGSETELEIIFKELKIINKIALKNLDVMLVKYVGVNFSVCNIKYQHAISYIFTNILTFMRGNTVFSCFTMF